MGSERSVRSLLIKQTVVSSERRTLPVMMTAAAESTAAVIT